MRLGDSLLGIGIASMVVLSSALPVRGTDSAPPQPGTIITVAGTGERGYAGDGELATKAKLSTPAGLAFDAAGNLYNADRFNHRVRKVGADGVITTVAGIGKPGYSGNAVPRSPRILASSPRLQRDQARS
jgi:hypothetical protein